MPLDLRMERGDFFGGRRMLQEIQRAAVGDGRDQRAELERRHGNAFAIGTQAADAALARGRLMSWKYTGMFTRDIQARKFAQPELPGVFAHFGKTQTPSHFLN